MASSGHNIFPQQTYVSTELWNLNTDPKGPRYTDMS